MGFSLLTFLACIKWSQPLTTLYGKNTILAKHFPKRVLGWKPKIISFPPPPNHTLYESLDHGPTFLALVGSRLVVLRPLCGYSTTFCFCFLSFSCHIYHRKASLFHFVPCSFCLCLCFMEGGVGFLGFPHFCSFLGSWAFLVLLPIRLAHCALFISFFLSRLWPICFCLIFLSFLLVPMGLRAAISY